MIWLVNQTHPDILDAVLAVARYSLAPKLLHWQGALHVFMLFDSRVGTALGFRGARWGNRVERFVDSGFANTPIDRWPV